MTHELNELTQQAINEAAILLVRSSYVVALVGAGMSAESGIPTYRGPDGLWTKYGEPPMNSYQLFTQSPSAWWEQQLSPDQPAHRIELLKALDAAKPNTGHYALVELEEIGALKYIITQNVDNLHLAAGSKRVAEIHGNRTKLRCIECGYRRPREGFEVDDLPPHCPQCNGIIKNDTVMFGEPIPADVLNMCMEQAAKCDCMMLIGTSATVYPAAAFPEEVRARGAPLIEINPSPTPLSDSAHVVLRESSAMALPQIAQRVKNLKRA